MIIIDDKDEFVVYCIITVNQGKGGGGKGYKVSRKCCLKVFLVHSCVMQSTLLYTSLWTQFQYKSYIYTILYSYLSIYLCFIFIYLSHLSNLYIYTNLFSYLSIYLSIYALSLSIYLIYLTFISIPIFILIYLSIYLQSILYLHLSSSSI